MRPFDRRLDIVGRRLRFRLAATTQEERDYWMEWLLFSMDRLIKRGNMLRGDA